MTPERRMLPRFLAFPVLAAALHALLIVRWDEWSWSGRAVVILWDACCWFCVDGSCHEAVHQTLFRNPRANLWWGRAVGTFIGIPDSVSRETHRSQHASLNTPADCELRPDSSPRVPQGVWRVFVWLDIVGGVVTAPRIDGRMAFVPPSRITVLGLLHHFAETTVCLADVSPGRGAAHRTFARSRS